MTDVGSGKDGMGITGTGECTMSEQKNPFPYPGARGVLSGIPASPVRQGSNDFGNLLVEAMVNASDALAVLTFGNPQQQREVEAWMCRNRNSSR